MSARIQTRGNLACAVIYEFKFELHHRSFASVSNGEPLDRLVQRR